MIARCPHCQTRYRIAREKLGNAGARLRCRRCRTVFQVTPPAVEASKPTIHALERVESVAASTAQRPVDGADSFPKAESPEPTAAPATAVVADSDPALAEASRKLLEESGIRTVSIDHGADALLQIVRRPPTLVVLGGHLTGVPAPALAELIRRNPRLSEVRIIRVAPIDEPAGVPEFDADLTLEPARAASGLPAALRRLGIGSPPAALPAPAPATSPAVRDEAASPEADPAPLERTQPPPAAPAPAAPFREESPPSPTGSAVGGAGESVAASPAHPATPPTELAAAERLARIAVSDIVLYNEDRFRKAVQEGSIPGSFGAELDEARAMFSKRIPESIRRQRDFLTEELVRRAQKLAQAS